MSKYVSTLWKLRTTRSCHYWFHTTQFGLECFLIHILVSMPIKSEKLNKYRECGCYWLKNCCLISSFVAASTHCFWHTSSQKQCVEAATKDEMRQYAATIQCWNSWTFFIRNMYIYHGYIILSFANTNDCCYARMNCFPKSSE